MQPPPRAAFIFCPCGSPPMWSGHSCPLPLILVLVLVFNVGFATASTPESKATDRSVRPTQAKKIGVGLQCGVSPPLQHQSQKRRTGVSVPHKAKKNWCCCWPSMQDSPPLQHPKSKATDRSVRPTQAKKNWCWCSPSMRGFATASTPKVKSDGQECPSHTSKENRRGLQPELRSLCFRWKG